MKQSQGLNGITLGSVMALLAIQPAFAAPAQVTAVQLKPTASGMDVVLQTKSGDRPQVFSVNRGNSWTADVTNTQLRLPGGSNFRQENPAPGIAVVAVTPIDANSIRVTVQGHKAAPVGQVSRPNQGGLVFNLSAPGGATAAPRSTVPAASRPAAQPTAPLPTTIAQAIPKGKPIKIETREIAPPPLPGEAAQLAPTAQNPAPTVQAAPLVPNPGVTVQSPTPVIPGVPPTLPRPVPPPVGDLVTGQVDASPPVVDLGSGERIPRLVLRDAPAREVLALLARAAGLNLVFVPDALSQNQQQQQQQPGQSGTEGPRISLDIENESVQDVFNYVLRVANLESNRVGRTIFVSTRLPNAARNVVIRSVRLNQVNVTAALNYLVTLGAESAVSRDRLVTSVNAVPVAQIAGGGTGSAITQSQTTTESRIENQRVNYVDSIPILRGLQAAGDERTNTITLTGTPNQVNIALAGLTQIDVRRRQVVVNVRVIDVDLLALDRFSTSFSFGVNDARFLSSGGVAVLNLGRNAPAATGADPTGVFGGLAPIAGNSSFNFARSFFAQLQAAITNNNAKILTDPTLVVQEGQTANVNLTQEVVTNINQQINATQSSTTITITVEKARAGLILPIKVDRIDDNGFISLSIAPSVSRPSGSITVNLPTAGGTNVTNAITLLAERRLESGQIRLRDGQTLVVGGIIQDQDRSTVTKVPILGDIPILGALFRRTNRDNSRQEVIVLVTPRILDDSQNTGFGYTYTPGREAQELNDRANQGR